MFEKLEIVSHLRDLGVTEKGIELVISIRSSPPARAVASTRKNVAIRFASHKMGITIQAESRNVEYPYVLGLEIDPDVLEYWDQPTSIKLSYDRKSGKRGGHRHIPDFLVIRENSINFVECKPEASLIKLEQRNPEIFCRDANGQWISKAGIEAVEKYGIGYQVFTPNPSDIILARNASFILDYINEKWSEESKAACEIVAEKVREKSIIRLDDLYESIGDRELVNRAIANQSVIVDWQHKLLCQPTSCYVYSSYARLEAHSSPVKPANWRAQKPAEVKVGAKCDWNGQPWNIINLGEKVTLQDQQSHLISIHKDDFEREIQTAEMAVFPVKEDTANEAFESIVKADEGELHVANQRKKILDEYKKTGINKSTLNDRTLRNWDKQASQAERLHGSYFLGLLPQTKKRGNRVSRIDPEHEAILESSIEESYEQANAPNKKNAHHKYIIECEKNNIDPVSYQAYAGRCAKRNQVKQTEARQGRRAANQIDIPNASEVDEGMAMPTHGDRAWETAHIDHTQIDEEVVSEVTGQNLGKPWLTILIDAFTRFILAFWLTFEHPSHRAVMAIVRQCVEKWNRLPQRIVMDGGKEFKSVYTQALFSSYGVDPVDRPPGEPRYGSPVERQFGGNDSRLIHNLRGNTKARKLLRSLSSSHDPSKLAVWTPSALHNLLTDWLFEVYPRLNHRGIAERPIDRFERSSQESGFRPFRFIPNDDAFYISTLPEVSRKTRRVRKSAISILGLEYRGVRISLAPFEGRDIPVRSDPYDISRAWVYVDGQWKLVVCTHDLVRHYMERGVTIAQIEISARLALVGREYRSVEKVILEFVKSIEAQEKLLLTQRQTASNQEQKIVEVDSAAVSEAKNEIRKPMKMAFID